MRMTIREANQNLVKIESDLFLRSLHNFDKSSLEIPYADILDDWRLGDDKRIYNNWNNSGEHLFLYRMQYDMNLELVKNTINRIMDHKQINFASKYFAKLFEKMPEYFVSDLFNKKCMR